MTNFHEDQNPYEPDPMPSRPIAVMQTQGVLTPWNDNREIRHTHVSAGLHFGRDEVQYFWIMAEKLRCAWCGTDQLYVRYHDEEWGVPHYDDQHLFEMLNLEGAQAGLSWITILKKRENYRAAFENFNPKKIAKFSDKKLAKLLLNPGIVRNRLKVAAVRTNAKCYFEVLKEFKSFSDYIWQFVDHKPIQNRFKKPTDVPAKTEISDKMSKDLKKRGFKFVGSTICYAYMQAIGMVNDHTTSCFRHSEVAT